MVETDFRPQQLGSRAWMPNLTPTTTTVKNSILELHKSSVQSAFLFLSDGAAGDTILIVQTDLIRIYVRQMTHS